VLLVVGLGLVAAFLFAVSASLQQHEAHKANRAIQRLSARDNQSGESGAGPEGSAMVRALARRLPRARLWRLGWLLNLAGFVVQGTALYLGSVALVQPLLVTQLLFAVPLSTVWRRRWPSRREWLSSAAICAGVAVFIVAHGGGAVEGAPDRSRIVLAGVCAAAAVVVLLRVSVNVRPQSRAALVAVGAGLCLAMSAALMTITARELVVAGVPATASDWPGYTLAVTAVAGVVLGQLAFATGSLATAVAAVTITNPVASYLIGVLAFHVTLDLNKGQLGGVFGSGALIAAGVVGLSHSSVARASDEDELDPISRAASTRATSREAR
jgi:drug/metabolite transporter (DMT)-like permease